ncbi:MAG: adenine phosphoribosyltransferase [Limisphaerales bacterium]|mgnify:CR=1 FL=1|jgi:adenine phosphoribosyltransferase|nr:adenine phosphoribosyltransferase [Verrucomicrobiota bacterium]
MSNGVLLNDIRQIIRPVPDFPKPGVIFRDITPLLADARLFGASLDMLLEGYTQGNIDAIAGVDSRGFIFGAAAAARANLPFIPIRKKNKLPWHTYEESYALEYGTDVLAIHQDAFQPDSRVLLVDDLLATGGTALASHRLIERCGAKLIGCTFLIELTALGGSTKLKEIPIRSLVQY